MKRFLITVPHCVCNSDSHISHSCDFVAEDAAKQMYHYFGDIKPIMIYADVNRDTVDYNRQHARDSEFRQIVRDQINIVDPYCLIDVHSFPEDAPGEFEGAEVAIGTNQPVIEPYLKDVVYYLSRLGIKTLAVGPIICDIVTEIKEYGIDSYLFEFNESLDINRMSWIVEHIVDYMMVRYYE